MNQFTVIGLAALVAAASATNPFSSKLGTTGNTRKAKMVSKLLEGARPTENSQLSRGLEAEVDLAGYEMKFMQCQFVKAYDDQLAEEQDASTVLATNRFIIFRLCPSGKCGSCSSSFGEYVIDLETYVEAAIEFHTQDREDACGFCNDVCYADDDAVKYAAKKYVNCNSCMDYCAKLDNMDANGYVESSNYAACTQINYAADGSAIFAGAMCSSSGNKLKIGAFSDEYCSAGKNLDVENYLEYGITLNNDILGRVSDSSSCISCTANKYEVPDGNDDDEEPNEMCNNMYEIAAKCESKYGFNNYWKGYDDYSNQYIQEDLVCDYIASLKSGSYDQYGEIVLSGSSAVLTDGANKKQKFAMTSFILGTAMVGMYAATLNIQLTKGAKAELSSQGGAMA